MAFNSPTMVADLWYDDGNIVLQAEASLFRVSLGVLAAHSSVFDDIRKLPQPKDQDMYGDCPLLILPDKAKDLENFLRAVYNSGFFEPPPSKTDIDTLAGILRLSTKYEIPYLRKRALRHLDTIACDTLPDFDTRKSKGTMIVDDTLAFCIADLAREMDLLWLLPPALYVCTVSFEEIVRGYMCNGEKRWMNSSQQVVCIDALRTLIEWDRNDTLSFLHWANVLGCTDVAGCNEGRLRFLEDYSAVPIPNPLAPFSELEAADFEGYVCTECCIVSRNAYLVKRGILWEVLPGIFGLPSWETLRSLRGQALNEI